MPNPKPTTVPAAAVRVGDKLVRRSDGFLFRVEKIEESESKVRLTLEDAPAVVKARTAKVRVVRAANPHESTTREGEVVSTLDEWNERMNRAERKR